MDSETSPSPDLLEGFTDQQIRQLKFLAEFEARKREAPPPPSERIVYVPYPVYVYPPPAYIYPQPFGPLEVWC